MVHNWDLSLREVGENTSRPGGEAWLDLVTVMGQFSSFGLTTVLNWSRIEEADNTCDISDELSIVNHVILHCQKNDPVI